MRGGVVLSHCLEVPVVEDGRIKAASLKVLFVDLLPGAIRQLRLQKDLCEEGLVKLRIFNS